MWICLNDAFLSIVEFEPNARLLLVRARKRGDLEVTFPGQRIQYTPDRDYSYRTVVSRKTVADVLAQRVDAIDYTNFKDSVKDDERHDAYMKIWVTMVQWSQGAFRKFTKPKRIRNRAQRVPTLTSFNAPDAPAKPEWMGKDLAKALATGDY